jgi:integrase
MDIKKSCRLCGIPEQKNILDCTHIFRHIEASWMNAQKIPLSDISYKLGHESDKSTSKYIHPLKDFSPT